MAGAWAGKIGERPLIAGGLAMQAAGFAWIALVARDGLGYPAMIAPLVLAGCGVSMAMPAAQSCVVGAVPPEAWRAAEVAGLLEITTAAVNSALQRARARFIQPNGPG